MRGMKDDVEAEIAVTGNAGLGGAQVWLSEEVSQRVAPLLSGIGIELLALADRERATVRVESITAAGRGGAAAQRLRIERHEGAAGGEVEFDAPNVWAAASCIVSQAFGLSPPLLTADVAMFAVIRAATRAAQLDSPILVTGQTGTGKELLVRLIHAASGRAGDVFSVNCAALSDAALADTPDDATRGGETRLAELCAASATTLFLDQVSELSPLAQARMLHAILQVGDCAVGARLVAAANRPLEPMVSSGEFKRELYDRLAVLTIGMPPLHARRADIALLAAAFLRVSAPQLSFTPGALKALGRYPFPGNVRELHNLVTRLAIMPLDGVSGLIHSADVRAQLVAPAVGRSIWKSSPFRMRREMAMEALTVCGGDRRAAARKLGISVRAFQQHVATSALPPRSR